MTLDPRTQYLLERYPDDLTDEELTELRALAEQDPAVEDLLDAILMTDAELHGFGDTAQELSDSGRDRLAKRLEDEGVTAWSTGGATPSGNVVEGPKSWSTGGATPSGNVVEGPKSWSTGGATPSGSSNEGPKAWSTGGATPSGSSNEGPKAWSTGGATPSGSSNEGPKAWSTGGATPSGSVEQAPGVVDFSEARRRRRGRNQSFLAIAALFLVGAVFVLRDQLRPPPVHPDFVFKGDGTEGAIRGSLFVRGEARLTGGETRRIDQPITFRVVMTDGASLALLESQNGKTFVVWPPPGKEWRVNPGTHLLQPGGKAAAYRPGSAGEARYTLIARDSTFDIPPDREVESPEAFGLAHEGATGLDELIVRWEEAAP